MDTLPVVTLVTPTYNQSDFLAETMDCVLSQDYPALEYVVIDDGSTDDTQNVLARYEGRITSLRQGNIGQARTLNKAWGLARGKYLGYLSSDDLLHASAIRRMVEVLESDEHIVCAYPNADLIDSNSRVIKRSVCRPFVLEDLVVGQECHIGPGALFRRTAFEAVGGWRTDLKLAPDREFWMRLAQRGRIAFVDASLAGYRLHGRSLSFREVSEKASGEYLRVLDDYFRGGYLPESIVGRRAEAYARATLLIARNVLRSGRISRGISLYRQACELHPPLRSSSVRLTLLRNILSKPARVLAARLRAMR